MLVKIVIGAGAEGNGANSVVLGNDNIQKTTLKGNVGIGTTNPQHNLSIVDTTGSSAVMSISSNGSWSAVDFQDNGNFKWGIGKDDSQNFYINDTWNNTSRLKINYQNPNVYLRGNVIVDSIFGSGSTVSASKLKMTSGKHWIHSYFGT